MQVMNNTARIYTVNGVRLMPGANTVADDAAKKLDANKGFADRVKKGLLSIAKVESKAAMPKASDKKED